MSRDDAAPLATLRQCLLDLFLGLFSGLSLPGLSGGSQRCNMSCGTYIFFRLGVVVRHSPRVSHFAHLSSLTETRYRGSTCLLALRGPVCLRFYFRGRCSRRYWILEKSIRKIFLEITPESCRAFHALSIGGTLRFFGHR